MLQKSEIFFIKFTGTIKISISLIMLICLSTSSFYVLASNAEEAFSIGYDAFEKGDYIKSSKWFHTAAELGHARAQYGLGLMYMNGEGVAKNDQEAVKWYRKSAAQGYVKARSVLAQ